MRHKSTSLPPKAGELASMDTREGGEIIYNWKGNPFYYILNNII